MQLKDFLQFHLMNKGTEWTVLLSNELGNRPAEKLLNLHIIFATYSKALIPQIVKVHRL